MQWELYYHGGTKPSMVQLYNLSIFTKFLTQQELNTSTVKVKYGV